MSEISQQNPAEMQVSPEQQMSPEVLLPNYADRIDSLFNGDNNRIETIAANESSTIIRLAGLAERTESAGQPAKYRVSIGQPYSKKTQSSVEGFVDFTREGVVGSFRHEAHMGGSYEDRELTGPEINSIIEERVSHAEVLADKGNMRPKRLGKLALNFFKDKY